jgi:hypothetical protein
MPLSVAWLFAMQAASVGAAENYFPPSLSIPVPTCLIGKKVWKESIISQSEARWYSSELRAAGEPPLFHSSASGEPAGASIIRFTWLRSFRPPVIVRVEGLTSGSPRLIARQLSGMGGYAPGQTETAIDRALTISDAQTLAALVAETHLTQPRSRPSVLKACGPSLGPPVVDGAEWLIEIADSRGYHVAEDTSPEAGDIRRLGLAMLALTGWKTDPVY